MATKRSWKGGMARDLPPSIEAFVSEVMMTTALLTATPAREDQRIAPVLLRFFDRKHRFDYVVLFLVGLLPLVYAYVIGDIADRTAPAVGCPLAYTARYRGMGSTPNWWFFSVILPTGLYLARQTAERLFCLSSGGICAIAADIGRRLDPREKTPSEMPDAEREQQAVSDGIRRLVFRKRLFGWLLALVTVIHVVDMREVLRAYLATTSRPACVSESDWTVMFQATTNITRAANLGLVATAYLCQSVAVYLGLLIFALGFIHNAAYLKLVYQRYRRNRRAPQESVVLWFADPSRCFGQQRLHELFDIQIGALLIAGLVIVLSRYRNVSTQTLDEAWKTLGHHDEWTLGKILGNFGHFLEHVDFGALFPDVGQVMLAAGFILCLLIVALPSALKFLPFRRAQFRQGAAPEYLAQFFPPQVLPELRALDDDEVTNLAALFARNSFWPAGDKKAELLFIFSFIVLISVLVPPPLQETRVVIIYVIALCFLAIGCAKAAFAIYRRALAHVDPRLITPAKEKGGDD